MDGIIASTMGELHISIGDLNDNGPEFYECEGETESCTQKNSFTGQVEEHSSAGLSVNELNIIVKDPDQVCSYNICMVSSEDNFLMMIKFFSPCVDN